MRAPLETGVALGALAAASLVLAVAPVNEVDERPFVRHGALGDTVGTEYGDFTVERVFAADAIARGSKTAAATGTFLVVDVELVARGESFSLQGVRLRDDRGRIHAPAEDLGCSDTVAAPTQMPWHARYCFDVPEDAIAGAAIVLSRGDWTSDDSDVRRDEVVEIDLEISADEARDLWRAEETWPAFEDGPYPPEGDDLEPEDDADPPVPLLEEES